ncbi:MAG: glycosyltransferase family 4 protein [Actinomycetota bacterium]|nr:glycosyltransferase family 4 protein [Actinomycetota bacterium]
MRIALFQPSYWPEVRRGSERLVHDLGTTLAARGHEVTLLTSHDAASVESVEDGIRIIRTRRLPQLRPLRRYEDHVSSIPLALSRLLRGSYDVVNATHLSYGWAAVKARRFGGPPVVFSVHGIPIRRYLVERRYRLEMMSATLAGATATTVLSEAARRSFQRYLQVDPIVIPGGVRSSEFSVDQPRSATPTLICAASLGDPRKRADLLFAAFAELRRRRPDLRLLCVRTSDPHMSPLEVSAPVGVEWIDVRDNAELARAYAAAWASVLPAVGEAFGLVLVESLVAGTPVVAASDGGAAEIVDSGVVGRLFAPDDRAGLVKAMDEALEIGRDPAVREACRERGMSYDWVAVAESYEQVFESASGK